MRKNPHPRDVDVGSRIRLNRTTQGLSQTELANMVGVSWQTIQKYESGVNRVGSSRLSDIAAALGVKTSELLIDEPIDEAYRKTSTGALLNHMLSKEGIRVHMAYFAIKDPKIRASLLAAIEHVARSLDNNGDDENGQP